MNTFYSKNELKDIGLNSYGENVLISRNAILYNPSELTIGNNVRIDDYVTISGKVVLKSYIHIAQFCSLYGGVEGINMDDFSGLSSKVTIYATSNDYSGNSMTNPMVPQKYKLGDKDKKVLLKKHVVVGCNSVILPGVIIEEGCSVGAMSLVGKSTEPWGIYAGMPVRRLKDRSKNLLKLEEKFKNEIVSSKCEVEQQTSINNSKFKIGMSGFFSKTITEGDIYLYAGITGDFNPVHINQVYAQQSRFTGRIAHGMIAAGLISSAIGMEMPGKGTIYLDQSLRFLKPVKIGDTITAKVTIKEILAGNKRAILTTICTNQDEVIVLDGEAKVILPE